VRPIVADEERVVDRMTMVDDRFELAEVVAVAVAVAVAAAAAAAAAEVAAVAEAADTVIAAHSAHSGETTLEEAALLLWESSSDSSAPAAAASSTPSTYPITEPPIIHPPYPTLPAIVPHSVAKSIQDLYEETLQALCKWLPKVFRTISSELCIDRGTKAVSKLIATPWTTNMRLPNPFNPDIRRLADDQQRQPTKERRRQGPFGV